MRYAFLTLILLLAVSCKNDTESKVESSNDWEYEQEDERSYKSDSESDDESQESTETSTYNPDKPASDLKAFGMQEFLKFNDLGGIALGMSKEDLENYNVKANQNLERVNVNGNDDQIRYYELSKGGVPMFRFYLKNENVYSISVLNKQAFPKNMIGLDDTFAAIQAKYPNPEVNADRVSVENDGLSLSFKIDDDVESSQNPNAKVIELFMSK